MKPFKRILFVISLALAPLAFAAKAPQTRGEAIAQAIERFERRDAYKELVARHKQEREALRARHKAEREAFKRALPGRIIK